MQHKEGKDTTSCKGCMLYKMDIMDDIKRAYESGLTYKIKYCKLVTLSNNNHTKRA